MLCDIKCELTKLVRKHLKPNNTNKYLKFNLRNINLVNLVSLEQHFNSIKYNFK